MCLFLLTQLDVVIVDLDGGSVKLPENVHISLLPEAILTRAIKSLQLVCARGLPSLPFPCLHPDGRGAAIG